MKNFIDIIIGFFLSIGIIFLISVINYSTKPNKNINSPSKPPPTIINDCSDSTYIYDSLYNEVINHLKEVEGFRSEIYLDNDGSKTIGYGHHLLPGEFFNNISEFVADSLLKHDFERRITQVSKDMPELEYNKILALSLFIYNCGSGNFNKSTLKKLVKRKANIDDEIIKWCHFKYKGEMIVSELLKSRREFELELYNWS